MTRSLFTLVLGALAAGAAPSIASRDAAVPADIVIRAADISQAALMGTWTLACDESAPDTVTLVARAEAPAVSDAVSASRGVPAAATDPTDPVDYFDVTFTAPGDTPYRLWLRLRTAGAADAVWVQFSDALVNRQPAYRLGSADGLLISAQVCNGCAGSGWGWRDTSWALQQRSTVTFASGGEHTLRVQAISPGVEIDQIVLSPRSYLNAAPGPVLDDVTRVGKR